MNTVRGWFTSEHWLSFGTIAAIATNVAGVVPLTDTAKVVIGSVAAIYTAARTILKAVRPPAAPSSPAA